MSNAPCLKCANLPYIPPSYICPNVGCRYHVATRDYNFKGRRAGPMTAMTSEREALLPCPFCGNRNVEVSHSQAHGITFLLCGDDVGRGGCGAVVSFRPNLTGSKAMQAYSRRASLSQQAVDVPEGFALVPLEPTQEMLDAPSPGSAGLKRRMWQIMLTAALTTKDSR